MQAHKKAYMAAQEAVKSEDEFKRISMIKEIEEEQTSEQVSALHGSCSVIQIFRRPMDRTQAPFGHVLFSRRSNPSPLFQELFTITSILSFIAEFYLLALNLVAAYLITNFYKSKKTNVSHIM